MKYCLTGGSGFIGTYFCEALAAEGHELVVLDLVDPPPSAPHDRFIRGDVRDPEACRMAVAGCDRVLHLAAAHHDFGIDCDTFFAVNETGTRMLTEAMDQAGVRELCVYSTVAVYGDAAEPRHEDTPPAPNTDYGRSKLAAENVCRQWAEAGDGRRCLVIRPTVTFGPRNFANMYTLIAQIHRGRFVLVGRAENIKSLSYVENIVQATLEVWSRTGRPAFDLLNYIDKPDLTSMQITKTVYEALGKRLPSIRLPMWFVRVLALPFDIVIALTGKNLPISSARVTKLFAAQTKFEAGRISEMGIQPRVPLRDGIRRMTEWYLQEGQHLKAQWHQPPPGVVPLEPTRMPA